MLTNPERPVGISILGMLHVIMGLVTMIAAFAAVNPMPKPERFGIGLIEVCLGIGLLRLYHWALPATIAVYALAIIGSISHRNLATLVLASAVIIYLCMPGVRRTFAQHVVGDSSVGVPKP
ncbi:MAG TPA: hypothetical protein VGX94_00725 [Terriglobia bacterium]|nr:hypothetical protein [Terriglobia bacterium]